MADFVVLGSCGLDERRMHAIAMASTTHNFINVCNFIYNAQVGKRGV